MTVSSTNLLADDLDQIVDRTRELWEDLRGQRIFVTGGTGFFGCWLLESLLWANDKLQLGVSVTVLTRDIAAFGVKAPHLVRHAAIRLVAGDVCSFEFPEEVFTYVIHAATASSSTLAKSDPLRMFDTIVSGTTRTLEFARRCSARRVLLTSSGAVYGPQPTTLSHLPEEYSGSPDLTTASSTYAEAKRAAEILCAIYGQQHGVHVSVARCFAFVGPYLPLAEHFAAGNFVRDGLAGGPIHVKGDGTPYRSYLYASDLAVWLWTILLRGRAARAYNVGSETPVRIVDLANLIATLFKPESSVIVAQAPTKHSSGERYVPSTRRAQVELGLTSTVNLEQALARTIDWHRRRLKVTHVDN